MAMTINADLERTRCGSLRATNGKTLKPGHGCIFIRHPSRPTARPPAVSVGLPSVNIGCLRRIAPASPYEPGNPMSWVVEASGTETLHVQHRDGEDVSAEITRQFLIRLANPLISIAVNPPYSSRCSWMFYDDDGHLERMGHHSQGSHGATIPCWECPPSAISRSNLKSWHYGAHHLIVEQAGKLAGRQFLAGSHRTVLLSVCFEK